MSFNHVGTVYSPTSLAKLLSETRVPSWAQSITLHHTAAPSLEQRPRGFTAQHIINMRDFYQSKGWKSGPHLYADDDQLWAMTPLTERGVHAVSFNSSSIGIEVLGDYDQEDPFTGRGLECWKTTAAAVQLLLKWIGKPANEHTILFHRDDPKTSKTCPGTKITKQWVLDLINGGNTKTEANHTVSEAQFEPIVEYVVKNKGYSSAEALKLFKKRGKLFFFGEDWIEGARYNVLKMVTEAPINELKQILHK